jgi:importin-9
MCCSRIDCLSFSIIKGLVHNSKVSNAIQERLIPLVQSIVDTPSNTSTLPRIAPSLAFSVLDLLTTVLRSLSPPINVNLFNQTFPIVVHLLLTSDDQQILINGGECLCAFLSCVSTQLFSWTDSKTNCSSIEYILQILSKFLDPKVPENCCTFIGKLIRGFIREINKTNQPSLLGDTLGQILKAVLAKLQSTYHSINMLEMNECHANVARRCRSTRHRLSSSFVALRFDMKQTQIKLIVAVK